MISLSTTQKQYLAAEDGTVIAYHHLRAKADGVGVLFLGGFMSDMEGSKALYLQDLCAAWGMQFTRMDYAGHGSSDGEFIDGTIGRWLSDVLLIMDKVCTGPQIVIGSSMGGWLMLLTALARKERVAGLIGIASAPDFTEDLLLNELDDDQRATLERDGVYYAPSCYGDEPYPITKALLDEGKEHLLLRGRIELDMPVTLLHGMKDPDVPWGLSVEISERVTSEDVDIHLLKEGDHRMSSEDALKALDAALHRMVEKVGKKS